MNIILFLMVVYSVQVARADHLAIALQGVITGIGQVFSTVLTTNCTLVKAILGLNYDQLNQPNNTPDLSHLTMDLYTANRTVAYSLSRAASLLLADPFFNLTLPITIFVHGLLTDSASISVTIMTSNLMKRGKSNVLFLDASSVIYLEYLRASSSVQFIGQLLGAQLAVFVAGGISPSNIHLIGHSLGAHISGFAGKTFQALTGTRFGRISGLDAAGPCFYNDASNLLLASTDAEFVDVIHTDAGEFGIIQPLGHVDFYPNSGANQPNSLIPASSHGRSWELFAESLLYETNFQAVACGSWSIFITGACNNNEKVSMGIAVPPTTRGIFYLKTGGVSLYGMGVNGTVEDLAVDPFVAFLAWWNSLFGIK